VHTIKYGVRGVTDTNPLREYFLRALNLIETYAYYNILYSPELFRVALHPGPISSADVAFESDDGETLLHAVAQAIASSMQPRSLKNKVRSQRECREDLEGSRHKPPLSPNGY